MRFMRHLTAGVFSLAFSALLLLAGCEGGGLLADGGIIGTGSIIGTVPGTIIEAYGDQGQYFETFSVNNNTTEHPFVLALPAGVGFHLVMITSEGTDDEVVTPIAFLNQSGKRLGRIILKDGDEINLGFIPLPLNRGDILPGEDTNGDGVLDNPFVLDDYQQYGAKNPLMQHDADDDGIDDFDDDDSGDPSGKHDDDPQDHDNDGVPNKYDDDFSPGSNDKDEDGIDDDEDENPGNFPHAELDDYDDTAEDSQLEWNGQGMHPVGQAWREQHGEYAEHTFDSCTSCHGDDFRGTPLSAQVGCYDCHDGPEPEDD